MAAPYSLLDQMDPHADEPPIDIYIDCYFNEKYGRFPANTHVLEEESEVFASLIENCSRFHNGVKLLQMIAPLDGMDYLILALHKDSVSVSRQFTSHQLIQTAVLGRELKCGRRLNAALENWSLHTLVLEPTPKVFSLAAMVIMSYILRMDSWFHKSTKYVLLNYTGDFKGLFDEQWKGAVPLWVSAELEIRRSDMRNVLRRGLTNARRDASTLDGTLAFAQGLNGMLMVDGYYNGIQSLSQTISTVLRFRTLTRMEMILQGINVDREESLPLYIRRVTKIIDDLDAMPQGIELPTENVSRRLKT
ncbi:Hypothetical protein D9617_13g100460 [Elsinoe fawcettii]|nr:Hypothetical protein D9617_13g100460 [Elsinoe fawcettii]